MPSNIQESIDTNWLDNEEHLITPVKQRTTLGLINAYLDSLAGSLGFINSSAAGLRGLIAANKASIQALSDRVDNIHIPEAKTDEELKAAINQQQKIAEMEDAAYIVTRKLNTDRDMPLRIPKTLNNKKFHRLLIIHGDNRDNQAHRRGNTVLYDIDTGYKSNNTRWGQQITTVDGATFDLILRKNDDIGNDWRIAFQGYHYGEYDTYNAIFEMTAYYREAI